MVSLIKLQLYDHYDHFTLWSPSVWLLTEILGGRFLLCKFLRFPVDPVLACYLQ